MALTIVYGTAAEMKAVTTPVINEVVYEMGIISPALVVLPDLTSEQLDGLLKAMDESETAHAIVFVTDLNMSYHRMVELSLQYPAIESFRTARAPFRKVQLLEVPSRSMTVH